MTIWPKPTKKATPGTDNAKQVWELVSDRFDRVIEKLEEMNRKLDRLEEECKKSH